MLGAEAEGQTTGPKPSCWADHAPEPLALPLGPPHWLVQEGHHSGSQVRARLECAWLATEATGLASSPPSPGVPQSTYTA
jgi:hypothetical protein